MSHLLLDANLSPKLRTLLAERGVAVTHVAALDLMRASDEEIFDRAASEGFVVVTCDSDFPNLLAWRRSRSPSVLLLRGVNSLGVADLAALLADNLATVDGELARGAVVSLSPKGMRVRPLPLR